MSKKVYLAPLMETVSLKYESHLLTSSGGDEPEQRYSVSFSGDDGGEGESE